MKKEVLGRGTVSMTEDDLVNYISVRIWIHPSSPLTRSLMENISSVYYHYCIVISLILTWLMLLYRSWPALTPGPVWLCACLLSCTSHTTGGQGDITFVLFCVLLLSSGTHKRCLLGWTWQSWWPLPLGHGHLFLWYPLYCISIVQPLWLKSGWMARLLLVKLLCFPSG